MRGRNGSRTVWTPETDRYFIYLLVDQIKKGNFGDQAFSKQAWKNVTLLFNAKFNLGYEKDVLKNRHKVLRVLYKSVKRLLNQDGFSWDDHKKMVSADAKVWDEYIKVHRDARSFRTRTIPYYKELCLIYGDSGVGEKGDDVHEWLPDAVDSETMGMDQGDSENGGALEGTNLQEIMVDEDYRISASKGPVGSDQQDVIPDLTGSNRARMYWQPPMDRYFIDLMLEEMRKGNQIDGMFRKRTWMDMLASFNAKFGFDHDVDVLKNRYKTLKKQYNAIRNLLELDGFAWDDTRQMVTADDSVWQDYIKKHTDARQFMTRPVPYYKDLCKICNENDVDETDGLSAQHLELQNGVQVKVQGLSRSCSSPAASVSSEDEVGGLLELASAGSKAVITDQRSKRKLESWSISAGTKRPWRKEDGMASVHREVATGIPSSYERKDENSNPTSIEKVVKSVQALPDMDDDLILDACDFLEDETRARTFMALDVKLRKKWLLRKLRQDPNHKQL